MPQEAENGLMVKYQFEIDDETWLKWKNTVPRSKSLEQRIIELIEADAEGRVQPPEEDEDIVESDSSGHEDALLSEEESEEAKEAVGDLRGRDHDRLDDAQAAFENEAEEILRNLDNLSGSGSKYDARVNAVLEFYDYLRDRPGERVSKGDLEALAEERDLDVGYASFGSFWGNWVKKNTSQGRDFNTLAQLPGVEIDGDDYVYTGESA